MGRDAYEKLTQRIIQHDRETHRHSGKPHMSEDAARKMAREIAVNADRKRGQGGGERK